MPINRRQLLRGSTVATTHISSLVVHSRPEAMPDAIARIAALPNAEVPKQDARGKFVVLLENTDQASILDDIRTIESMNGVINATLVYHQIDD